MAVVHWNRQYATRLGLPDSDVPGADRAVRLRPGRNDLDDATLQRLQKTPAFERLRAARALVVEPEAKPRDVAPKRAPEESATGEPRPRRWDPGMTKRELAAALQSRGGNVTDEMTRQELVEELRALDETQGPRR